MLTASGSTGLAIAAEAVTAAATSTAAVSLMVRNIVRSFRFPIALCERSAKEGARRGRVRHRQNRRITLPIFGRRGLGSFAGEAVLEGVAGGGASRADVQLAVDRP